MNVVLLAAIAGIILVVAAFPVIAALRRRAWPLALIVGIVGLAVPAAFLVYLATSVTDHHDAIAGFLIGLPVLSLATCVILMRIVSATTRKDM